MTTTQHAEKPTEIDQLFERSIIDVGIPPCPAILTRFMAEANRDEPDFGRLSGIIGSDVGISASLIKTANSPFFGMRQRVRSINESLTVLGLKATSSAVAGIILRNTFPHVPNLERFWDASARIAHLSAWLAQNLRIRGLLPEDAHTFGLFRDCGIPVLLSRFPHYREVLIAANSDVEHGFIETEQQSMPTNHAMVGCILAQSWWLPEEICLAIRNHHDLNALQSANSSLPMLSRRLIATSQFAEHILQRQLNLSLTQEWNKLGPTCLKLLDIEEAHLENLYAAAEPIAAGTE